MRHVLSRRSWVAVLVVLGLAAAARLTGLGRSADAGDPPASKFHLGSHTRPVSTRSCEAQQAFDRGLTLAFSFSYAAAEDEFRRAATLDPNLAMAWWGVALVNGPHINLPIVLPDQARKASEALVQAHALLAGASDAERALIGAQGTRHADPQPADRAPLDQAYAVAMRKVRDTYPKDADIACLYAEALMDLHPWDLWTSEGTPKEWTPEILAEIERAIELNAKHPGALHLYVHAVEASAQPEKGLYAADTLKDLVPGAGHMVHMPAHIYARVGRWADAAAANVRAIEADAHYRAQHPRPGFYGVYMAHNRHFLAFTAMMRGRSAEALEAARALVKGMPPDFLADFAAVADGFMIFPAEVLMRFGRWDDILAEPEPAETFPIARALWRFTRGVALNAKGDAAGADKERTLFKEAVAKVPPEAAFGNASGTALLAIAGKVLDGEIEAKAGRFDAAVVLLREAITLEDALRYDEPPDWIQPVRHTLGAALMTAKRHAEAETVYLEDLRRWPENGWSLLGLAQSLHAQEKHHEAHAADARVERAWADADVKPTSTCLCLPGK